MKECSKLQKGAKIQVISRHVRSQSVVIPGHNIADQGEGIHACAENDSELSDDDMDEVRNCISCRI